MTSDSSNAVAGLIKVVFFFSQIYPLLRLEQNTSGSFEYSYSFIHMTSEIQSIFSAFLNFQARIFRHFKTLTAVTKTAVLAAFPMVSITILGMLLISYWISKVMKKSVLKLYPNNTRQRESMFIARLASCFVNLVLLTFGTIAKTVLTLLHCTKINQTRVLYLDGTIICSTSWQYILAIVACLFVFPLSLGLALSVKKLKNKELTVRQFLVRLCPPLIFIFDTVRSCINLRKHPDQNVKQKTRPNSDLEIESQDLSMETESYVQEFERPFRSLGHSNDATESYDESEKLLVVSSVSREPLSCNDYSQIHPHDAESG